MIFPRRPTCPRRRGHCLSSQRPLNAAVCVGRSRGRPRRQAEDATQLRRWRAPVGPINCAPPWRRNLTPMAASTALSISASVGTASMAGSPRMSTEHRVGPTCSRAVGPGTCMCGGCTNVRRIHVWLFGHPRSMAQCLRRFICSRPIGCPSSRRRPQLRPPVRPRPLSLCPRRLPQRQPRRRHRPPHRRRHLRHRKHLRS